MSLEVAIADLTAAVKELTAQMQGAFFPVPAPTAVTITAAPNQPVVNLPFIQAQAQAQAQAEAPQVVKYDADAISAKVVVNRKAVVALLAEFGAQKGPQLKESDYPAFFERLAKIEKAA